MQIKVFIQANTKNDFWNQQARKAIAAEILRKRYASAYFEALDADELDFDKIFAKDEQRVMLYIGYAKSKTPANLQHMVKHGVHPILINNGLTSFSSSCSRVFINYREAAEKAIGYLTANGRSRIALYGINPSSPTDKIMEDCFADHMYITGKEPQHDVYYNYASIAQCYAEFGPHAAAYDAVICANDIIAVTLIGSLKAAGIRVPEDLYVLSCGISTLFAEQAAVPVTTISVEHEEIGKQAILAYSILQKNADAMTLTLRAAPKLTVRASTDFAPPPKTFSPVFVLAEKTTAVNFYKDPATQSFFSIENLLLGCDDLDRGILHGILMGETYPSIAERLYTSGNMISYRVKRMCRLAGCANRQELITLVAPYLQ